MKYKKLFSIVLAIILAVSFFSVHASASTFESQSVPSKVATYLRVESYFYTHPKEIIDIMLELDGGKYDALNRAFPNEEDRELFLKLATLPSTVGDITKTATITADPKNTERYIIPSVTIGNSSGAINPSSDEKSGFRPSFTFLAIPNYNENKISLDTFGAYKDTENNLVVLGIIRNGSGKKLELKGISYIELSSNGKVLAKGTPSAFESPMQFSPYKAEFNTGVNDGLPTKCFIKLTFKPGTYDDTIDISTIDNLTSSYTLDYYFLK